MHSVQAEGLLEEQLLQPGSHTPTTEVLLMVTMVLPELSARVRQGLLLSQVEQKEGHYKQELLEVR